MHIFIQLLNISITHTHISFVIYLFYLWIIDRHKGALLMMRKVQRSQMGAYRCIASNDVPPAVSKRVILNVNCKNLPTSSCYIAYNFCKFLPSYDIYFTTLQVIKTFINITCRSVKSQIDFVYQCVTMSQLHQHHPLNHFQNFAHYQCL